MNGEEDDGKKINHQQCCSDDEQHPELTVFTKSSLRLIHYLSTTAEKITQIFSSSSNNIKCPKHRE